MDYIKDHGLAAEKDCACSQRPARGGVPFVTMGISSPVLTDPLANHSDPTITGCRRPCNTSAAKKTLATIDSVSCLSNHNESHILSFLQSGPVAVSIAAGYLNGYKVRG